MRQRFYQSPGEIGVWTDVPEFADWIACVLKTDDADIEKRCAADRVTAK